MCLLFWKSPTPTTLLIFFIASSLLISGLLFWKYFIKTLLTLEMLSILIIVCLSLSESFFSNSFTLLMVLAGLVCEAILGLSALVSFSRAYGKDKSIFF